MVDFLPVGVAMANSLHLFLQPFRVDLTSWTEAPFVWLQSAWSGSNNIRSSAETCGWKNKNEFNLASYFRCYSFWSCHKRNNKTGRWFDGLVMMCSVESECYSKSYPNCNHTWCNTKHWRPAKKKKACWAIDLWPWASASCAVHFPYKCESFNPMNVEMTKWGPRWSAVTAPHGFTLWNKD